MPTNVSAEYLAAQKKYEEARTLKEKVTALQEMLREAPKHKGAEKLRAELGKRLARMKEELKKEKQRKKGRRSLAVKKQGFQICIIGSPNTGKSTLLKKLTNANPKIAGYPFTTTKPEVGMMESKGALIQVVEIPALERGAADKQAELLSIVMNTDGIIMITRNQDEQDILQRELDEFGIKKPTIYLRYKEEIDKEDIVKFFKLIRVYTKEPGEDADMERALLLKEGATVLDAAKKIHKDFYKNLKFARVWGSSKFPGQRVEKEYKLKDGDIVEFHI
ncbi:hypothetical protein DRN74_03810 [Candidatus Micrarchaeota archaeon]|nr:MAG: hypothetical protein DRN74_03810 [Candidatus Micrarchaeota archaeon]